MITVINNTRSSITFSPKKRVNVTLNLGENLNFPVEKLELLRKKEGGKDSVFSYLEGKGDIVVKGESIKKVTKKEKQKNQNQNVSE